LTRLLGFNPSNFDNPESRSYARALARTQNSPFPSEINTVRFCYQDKFVLLSSRNRLSLFKYFIDPSRDQDLKRCAALA
jgi:hypothetical protein